MANTDFNFGHSEKEVRQFALDFSQKFPVSAQIGMKQALGGDRASDAPRRKRRDLGEHQTSKAE